MTIWTARSAAALYAIALALLLGRRIVASRRVSLAGLAVYLVHVACAFEFFYEWSHATAYRETARQTQELFSVNWGGGLYLNYVFTVLWAGECMAAWAPPEWQSRTLSRARAGVHAFLAFMVVNATAVVWVLRARRQ